MNDLYNLVVQERFRNLKVVALDVDGVLTDGRVFWVNGQGWTRFYNVRDGFGIRMLLDAGVEVALISAGSSEDLKNRAEVLGVRHVYLGSEDKLPAFKDLLKKTGVSSEDSLYFGDELFDIPVLEAAGFAVTVSHAPERVKKVVDYITTSEGGFGAVREVADAILTAKGHHV